ncbi:MAG: hypothetical protein Q8P93_00585 [bacterium]|nr:hypothetical protein [bacterium]
MVALIRKLFSADSQRLQTPAWAIRSKIPSSIRSILNEDQQRLYSSTYTDALGRAPVDFDASEKKHFAHHEALVTARRQRTYGVSAQRRTIV